MIKSTYNYKFSGRLEKDIKNGVPASPQFKHEYETTMTDQSFNYTVADKVQDFIAAGQVISAISSNRNSIQVPIERQITGFYPEDLPVEQQKVREQIKDLTERLKDAELKDSEKEKYKKQIEELKKAFSE